MQNYVWGVLASLFILDIVRINYLYYNRSQIDESTASTTITSDQQKIHPGLKVKLEDGNEIKVEYDNTMAHNTFDPSQSMKVKILYCTS